jgi:hypothetical protein
LGLALLATLLLPTMATVLAGRSRGSNGRPVCAIGALRDLSDRADSAWLGEALREMLAAELARDALQAMSDDDAARQGAVCLAGSYLALGGREGRVRIDLMLRARRAGDTATLTRVGRRQDLPALVASLAEDVRETLGLPSDGSSGEAARLALSSYVAAGRQPPEPSPPPPAVP